MSSKQDGNFKRVFAKFELSLFCFLDLKKKPQRSCYGYILFFFSLTLLLLSGLNNSIYTKKIPALGFANCSEVEIVVSSPKFVVCGDNALTISSGGDPCTSICLYGNAVAEFSPKSAVRQKCRSHHWFLKRPAHLGSGSLCCSWYLIKKN